MTSDDRPGCPKNDNFDLIKNIDNDKRELANIILNIRTDGDENDTDYWILPKLAEEVRKGTDIGMFAKLVNGAKKREFNFDIS